MAAAALEGVLAGGGVRQRLRELRMPTYSPPFVLWLVIGSLYYVMCFVILRALLSVRSFSSLYIAALTMMIIVLLANAFWNMLFFRWRALRASFVAFIPYAIVVAALVVLLTSVDSFAATLLGCYCAYLIYATWWSYRLWRINTPGEDGFVR